MKVNNLWMGLMVVPLMLIRSCGYEYPLTKAESNKVTERTYSSATVVGHDASSVSLVQTDRGKVVPIRGLYPAGTTWKSVRIKDGKLSGIQQP